MLEYKYNNNISIRKKTIINFDRVLRAETENNINSWEIYLIQKSNALNYNW